MTAHEPFDVMAVSLDGTTLIEASAGTGKTHTLSTLVVRLLVEKGHAISEILVVTYTRAATAELRQRVRMRIAQALECFERDGVPVPELAAEGPARESFAQLEALAVRSRARGTLSRDTARLVGALRSFDQAAILTIHGFCQRMLTQRAVESRAAFEVEFVEDQAAWLDEVVRDYYARELYAADEALVAFLRSRGDSPAALLALATLALRSAGATVTPELTAMPLQEVCATFEQRRAEAHALWSANSEAIRAQLVQPDLLNAQSYSQKRVEETLLPSLRGLVDCSPGGLPDAVSALTASRLVEKTKAKARAAGKAPTHPFFDACEALVQADDAAVKALDNNRLVFLHGLITFVRRELPLRKEHDGVQSFDDLLVRLHDAILGPRGDELAARVREAYPAALIDEFQDTDPTQCRIFQRIYESEHKAPGALVLIGDPKQAIYGFRGADVFAYLSAAKQAGAQSYSLDINYRSDPRLLAALNACFEAARAPFLFDEVQYQRVQPPRWARDQLSRGDRPEPAFEVLFSRRTESGTRNKGELRAGIPGAVADEIVALLTGAVRIDGKKVEPRHIAVLCRRNDEAREVQAALRARGVPAVLDGDASVFETSMAAELERVLSAVEEPTDAGLVRAALATSMFGVTAAGLLALEQSEPAWDLQLTRFHRWHELWSRRGFIQAFHALCDDAVIAPRLLCLPDGERRLTDLMHLGELLHAEALQRAHGPQSLLAWFRRMTQQDGAARAELPPQSVQLRMESDAHAVTLTTIHKSKGLEYPIVYLPYLWDGSIRSERAAQVVYHEGAQGERTTLDLRGAASPGSDQAAREELAENLRLLYVALTRAKHKLSVVWGSVRDAERSALAYLLHQPPLVQPSEAVAATRDRVKQASDEELLADLERLSAAGSGALAVRVLESRTTSATYERPASRTELQVRTLGAAPRDHLRFASFSRLASGARSEAHGAGADDGVEHDAATAAAMPPSASMEEPERVLLAAFPSGAGPGHLIHSIYESIDFRAHAPEALREHVDSALLAYGVDLALSDGLCRAVSQTLLTPLGEGLPMLACVAPQDRLVELEFVFPVALDSVTSPRLSPLALSEVLARHARDEAERRHAAQVGALGFEPLRGYMRGFMDLVVRHEGRYFLLDYKSNNLGPHAEDYTPAQLATQMAHHHYVLQYMLYAVALHRHLSLRLPDYDYERCFGGVYYLFVRGMSPAHAPGTGVYYSLPSQALITELSELLGIPGGLA